MCVVSHVFCGLDGCRDGDGGWYAYGTKPGQVVRMSGYNNNNNNNNGYF